VGFSHDLYLLLSEFGMPELINCEDKTVVARAIADDHAKEEILRWERMKKAKSTGFLCSVFLALANFLMLL
jgi:hypothetical protein